MTLFGQSWGEFAVLTLLGAVLVALAGAVVCNFRGLLDRYVHSLVLHYQKPWYQKYFLWTAAMKNASADERKIRLNVRIPASVGLVGGLFITAMQTTALINHQVH